MKLLHVDQATCIKCGRCAAVCPSEVIGMEKDGPEQIGPNCISCGQCVAVCPVAALDNVRAPLAGQLELEKGETLATERAVRFLRSRRSIRSYKDELVPQEKLLQIIDIARYAATGGNAQGLSYMVISDKKKLEKIVAATVSWMEQEIEQKSAWSAYFKGIVRRYRETGKDVILRGAPHLIMAVAAKDFVRGKENAHFSLAYTELLAPTLGLGTCWAGFFQACAFSNYEPLLQILEIPGTKVLAGALMAGYPKYTYHRLVERNPLDISWG